jgi:glycosyltransferase involved in cell wall biosynthesis
MRIAVVSEGYFPEVSGVTIAVAQHVRYLAARGHEVLLAYPRYPDDVRASMGGVLPPDGATPRSSLAFHSQAIAPHRRETRVPSRAGAAELDAEIARFRPEAVVYHNADRLVPELPKLWKRRRVAGLGAARRAGAVAIPIIHTLLPLFVERSGSLLWRMPPAAALTRRIWSGIYNENFDFALTVDVAAREYLRSIGVRIPLDAGPYNGVDTSVFRPRAAPPPRGEGRPLRIAWIGRLVREKNAFLLPHFARALDDAGVPFALSVIGDGPLRPELARDLDRAKGTTFHGWLPPAEVAAELSRSDLYLSLSDTESYSLTASEALASGVPVVAPDVIGFRRLAAMDVGALFPASWLTPSGVRNLSRLVAASAPRLDEWARRAAAAAPRLSWGAALDALYGDLGERTRLRFVS